MTVRHGTLSFVVPIHLHYTFCVGTCLRAFASRCSFLHTGPFLMHLCLNVKVSQYLWINFKEIVIKRIMITLAREVS